jgi:hypothetical protein
VVLESATLREAGANASPPLLLGVAISGSGLGDQGGFFIINFLLLGPILLGSIAVVMTWIYNRSGGNLLLMVLFHYTVTSSGIILAIPGLAGMDAVVANALYAGVFCLIAVALIVATRGRLGKSLPQLATR